MVHFSAITVDINNNITTRVLFTKDSLKKLRESFAEDDELFLEGLRLTNGEVVDVDLWTLDVKQSGTNIVLYILEEE